MRPELQRSKRLSSCEKTDNGIPTITKKVYFRHKGDKLLEKDSRVRLEKCLKEGHLRETY